MENQAYRERVFKLREEGFGATEISKTLNDEGFLNSRGGKISRDNIYSLVSEAKKRVGKVAVKDPGLDERLLELRREGYSFSEVADKLNADGFQTTQDKKITESWARSRVSFLNYKHARDSVSAKIPKKKSSPKKSSMIEIPIALPKRAKVMVLIAERDDAERMIEKFMGEG